MTKRISLTDTATIQELINQNITDSSARCISAKNLISFVERWEKRVCYPSKSILNGVKLEIRVSDANTSICFRNMPREAVVYLRYGTEGWYVAKVSRKYVRNSYRSYKVTPTDSLCAHILKNALTC